MGILLSLRGVLLNILHQCFAAAHTSKKIGQSHPILQTNPSKVRNSIYILPWKDHDLVCHPSHVFPPFVVLFIANAPELRPNKITVALLLSRFKIIPDPYCHNVVWLGISSLPELEVKNDIPVCDDSNNAFSVVRIRGPDNLENRFSFPFNGSSTIFFRSS